MKKNDDYFDQMIKTLEKDFFPEFKNLFTARLPLFPGLRLRTTYDSEFTGSAKAFSIEIELLSEINPELPFSDENEYLARGIDFVVLVADGKKLNFEELEFFPSIMHEEDHLDINRQTKIFFAKDLKQPDTLGAIIKWIKDGELHIDSFFQKPK